MITALETWQHIHDWPDVFEHIDLLKKYGLTFDIDRQIVWLAAGHRIYSPTDWSRIQLKAPYPHPSSPQIMGELVQLCLLLESDDLTSGWVRVEVKL